MYIVYHTLRRTDIEQKKHGSLEDYPTFGFNQQKNMCKMLVWKEG